MMWLVRFLTGSGLVGQIADAYAKAKDTQVERERLAYEAEARRLEGMLRVRQAGGRLFDIVAVLIAAPFVIHLWAVGLDTVLTSVQWGIPAFPPPFDEWEGRVLLSFFGLTATARVASTAVRIFGR